MMGLFKFWFYNFYAHRYWKQPSLLVHTIYFIFRIFTFSWFEKGTGIPFQTFHIEFTETLLNVLIILKTFGELN